MTKKVFVVPAEGVQVRTEDGSRLIKTKGEHVPLNAHYRRRIADGDLVEPTKDPLTDLQKALSELVEGNPDHYTSKGEPSLNHLKEVLGRQVSREEVTNALKEMGA